MNNEKEIQKKVLEFHGHSCPGVAIGIRAAEIDTDKLFSSRDWMKVIGHCENDSCSVMPFNNYGMYLWKRNLLRSSFSPLFTGTLEKHCAYL